MKQKVIHKNKNLEVSKMMNEMEKKAVELGHDMEQVKKELKRLASVKCRLNKQKGKPNYAADMAKVLEEEALVKAVRDSLSGHSSKTVTHFTKEDVEALDYDETVRAIKSIQSKKSLTKWLTDVEGDNDEYRAACEIEAMLKEHRDLIKPATPGAVSKMVLADILNNEELSDEEKLRMVRDLL